MAEFSERDKTIDIAKGIGILLVVIGHINLGSNLFFNTLNNVIYSFHMPLFFFISGKLFVSKGNFKEKFKKRVKRLIKPYIIFSIIDYGIWLILQRERIASGQYYYVIEPIISGSLFIRSNFNGAIWFLTCIFITELIFYILIKISKENSIKLLVTIILLNIIGKLYIKYVGIPLPFNIDISFNMIIFYYLGYLFKGKKLFNNKSSFILNCILICILIILSKANGVVDIFCGLYGDNCLLFMINSILGIVIIFKLSNNINNSRLLEFNGKNSLVILAVHQQFVIRVLAPFIKAHNPEEVVIYTFIYFILAISVSYFAVLLINKKKILIKLYLEKYKKIYS